MWPPAPDRMLDNLPVVPANSPAVSNAETASWPAVLAVGSVVGLMVVALILSMAALVYSGTMGDHLATGSSLFLLGGGVLNLVVARWGSLSGSVMLPQDTTSAVVAVTLAALLPGVAAADRLGTVIAYTAIAAVVAGGIMLLLGTLRLGDVARLVPLPVIGGFLAGTGWLLVVGSTDLVTGGFDWSGTDGIAFVSAAVYGGILLLLLRHRPGTFVFPGMIVLGLALFYSALLVSGTSAEEARVSGLLPMTSGSASGFPVEALGAVDWAAVFSGWVGFLTVILVSTLALLLNVTSLELIGKTDADFDRELRTVGGANLLMSLTGASPGYHGLGATALGWRLGVVSRRVPVVVAVVCLGAAAGGSVLIGLLPTPLVAGVLFMLGLSFMADWLWDARRQMTGPEYLLMVAIAVAVATLGYLAAVFLGMAAAGVLFAITYSQFDPIRHVASGKERRSALDRQPGLERLLDEGGDAILVIELQGYLFFGSAKTVFNRVRALAQESPGLRYLILDLRRVNGTDSTALASFIKLGRLADELACQLLFSDVPEQMASALEEFRVAAGGSWVCVPDLDHGLEMAEDMV
ncbi:MAG: SulP family inorganic anion transporter, partial [Acidimicrobiia bacterium]